MAVDDAGRRREQGGVAFQRRLQGAGRVARQMLQVVDAVGAGTGGDGFEFVDLGRAGGDDQLAAAPVGNPAFGAVGIQLAPAGDAKPRLERAGRVVDAGVDHFAVARADAGAEGRFGFEDNHLAAPVGKLPCHGEADDTGADHHAIDFFHRALWQSGSTHTMRKE
jgi:hypothetical protein